MISKKLRLTKIIDWILNILIVVFLIGTIYMVLWRVFGNSPTDFEIISWVVGLLSVAVFKIFNFTYRINREVGELKTGIKELKVGVGNGFNRIKEDMNEIKNKLSS